LPVLVPDRGSRGWLAPLRWEALPVLVPRTQDLGGVQNVIAALKNTNKNGANVQCIRIANTYFTVQQEWVNENCKQNKVTK
jgi:hypothetical protein